MSKHKAISDFSEFITEGTIQQDGKFFDFMGSYIYTDFDKGSDKEKVQRYKNNKTSVALNMLELIYKSGKEGVRYSDLSRLYYEMGADKEGKRDRGGYDWNKKVDIPDHRKWNPTEDRGFGSSFLTGNSGRWSGDGQVGILYAHCTKNDQKRWVLTDPILIEVFAAKWAREEEWEQSDIDMLDELGILGKTAAQYREDK